HPREMTVGVPSNWFFDICDSTIAASIDRTIEFLEHAGVNIRPVTMRHGSLSVDIGRTILRAEAAAAHAANEMKFALYDRQFLGTIRDAAGIEATEYIQALRKRHLVQREVQSTLEDCDALLLPGAIGYPPKIDSLDMTIDGSPTPWAPIISRSMFLANVAGAPAISVPTGENGDGLPHGIQLLACPNDELTLLRL